jgi:hypothetical protein
MSEEAQVPEQDQAASPRRLSMQERLDVVDCLRARTELIVAESNAEAARIVSQLSGVEVSAAQLNYIIEALPKLEPRSQDSGWASQRCRHHGRAGQAQARRC